MILSLCYHCSLNNDSHCHCHGHWHCHCCCHYMQQVYVYFISPCLVLTYLVLSWLDYNYYCDCMHDVVWAGVTFPYHISCSLLSSVDLFPFDSILLYFISNWFDSIQFVSIRFTILFSIVSHINEWFVSICLFVCLNKFLFSLRFTFIFYFLFFI